MKDRLTSLLESYRERPETEADQSLWGFVAERDPHVFSHHPATPAFREHVWKVGGLYFCKGCVVTFFGILFGAAFYFATGWLRWFSDFQLGVIFVVVLAPTLFAHLFGLPRWFRHLSRFLLGALIASALILLFVTDSWLIRGLVVVTYFAVKIPMERRRNRENQKVL